MTITTYILFFFTLKFLRLMREIFSFHNSASCLYKGKIKKKTFAKSLLL